MPVRLNSIEGLMPRKLSIASSNTEYKNGWNSLNDCLKSKQIGINRERFIRLIISPKISILIRTIAKSEGTYLFAYDKTIQDLIDNIIREEETLIEVKH